MNKKKYSSVIVAGSVAYDEIMDFPGRFVDYLHPEKLHQINVSFVVDKLNKEFGGIATNIAYNLSLLIDTPIKVLSAIGKDGSVFIDFFKKNGIRTDGIFIDKRLYTASGKAMTDILDNQIWAYYYGALRYAKKISLNKIKNKNPLLILAATHRDSFIQHQKQAIRSAIDYMYDPGMALTWLKDKELIEGVINARWLVGNDYEIVSILKRIKKTVGELIRQELSVITTLGETGVLYQARKEVYKVKGYKVHKVVDPTGAGDAWRAGFIAGIVEDKSIPYSLRQANALASFAIEKYGTVNHHPSKNQIEMRAKKLYSYKLSI